MKRACRESDEISGEVSRDSVVVTGNFSCFVVLPGTALVCGCTHPPLASIDFTLLKAWRVLKIASNFGRIFYP